MKRKTEIICTIGPSTMDENIMNKLKAREVDLVRINLSHINLEDLEKYIVFLNKFDIPVAIDTEGAQIRTGNLGENEIKLSLDDIIFIHNKKVKCNSKNIYLTPNNIINLLKEGNLISLDFNSVLLRVEDISEINQKGYIKSRVIIEGSIASNKGVHCEGLDHGLPAFSERDREAIRIAKKYKIKYFTLSFIKDKNEILEFRDIYSDSIIYAKIENMAGVNNIISILKNSDGILIDRGDLSREVPIHKLPLTQKVLIKLANRNNKKVFIASNLLETMANALKPSRAEVNDIVNTVLDNVSGFVLTKETAVGKYPIETINMLDTLIRQGEMALKSSKKVRSFFTNSINLNNLIKMNYITEREMEGVLVNPHGGKLVEKYVTKNEQLDFNKLKRIEVDESTLMDMEQICIGTYSPLEGFMCEEDYKCVLENMKLKNGLTWTIPIILTVEENKKNPLKIGERVAITLKGDSKIYGLIKVEDIYKIDKNILAKKMYNTTDNNHPGVKMLEKIGEYVIGGETNLICRRSEFYSHYNLTPRQVRTIFEALGWIKVVGFHTRNVIHRSHEFIQMKALHDVGADGLFVQPIIGRKKDHDYSANAIIRAYEIMLERFYPRNKVIFSLFSTYSRYAGPREAIFTALCRQNYGCTHFIVGRDHTGCGEYFAHRDSYNIFNNCTDLNIKPVFFNEVGYSKKLNKHVIAGEVDDKDFLKISGTDARKMFKDKILPPEWFMRREISELIISMISKNERVFYND